MNQLALSLKESGLDAVESTHMSWVETMRRQARYISAMVGQVTADDVRDYAERIGWMPDSSNAFGAVFRGKAWRCVGRKQSTHPTNHAREIRIWRYEA